MAEILPIQTTLSDQKEFQDFEVVFSAQLDSTETLVSLDIIEWTPNEGVQVSGSKIEGQYKSSAKYSIDVRMRKDGTNLEFNSFDSLPDPSECDIFNFKAPSSITNDYTYKVKLVYDESTEPPVGSVEPPVVTRKELFKTYTQKAFGDYSIWANKLRDFVSKSGNFPTR